MKSVGVESFSGVTRCSCGVLRGRWCAVLGAKEKTRPPWSVLGFFPTWKKLFIFPGGQKPARFPLLDDGTGHQRHPRDGDPEPAIHVAG